MKSCTNSMRSLYLSLLQNDGQAGVSEIEEADLLVEDSSQSAQLGSLDPSNGSENGSGETQLCANNPTGDGNLWCCQRLHQTKFGPSQSTHEAKLGSGESCKRTEKLRLESSKGLDDIVLLLPDRLEADGGGGGGGVHGDCHHYQQHQVFQRHRDWLQCNLLVCLLRWSVAVSHVPAH